MVRILGVLLAILTVLAFIGGPLAYALYDQNQMRNFHVVKEGVLYRSGQMSLNSLKRAVHDFGIRTVVNLRDGVQPADVKEEAYCNKEELNFIRLKPLPWEGPPGVETADKNVKQFLDVLRDPHNHPVLVHCFAGIHRTGAHISVYRMEVEHWSNERAVAELKAMGYTHLDSEGDILGYLERYRPSWRK